MPDSTKTAPSYAELQQRVTDLETFLEFRSGQCALAVTALTQVSHVTAQLMHDTAISPQTVMDATRSHLGAAAVIDMLADAIGDMGDGDVLRDAVEVAQNAMAFCIHPTTRPH
jgi:hypothetical protein